MDDTQVAVVVRHTEVLLILIGLLMYDAIAGCSEALQNIAATIGRHVCPRVSKQNYGILFNTREAQWHIWVILDFVDRLIAEGTEIVS